MYKKSNTSRVLMVLDILIELWGCRYGSVQVAEGLHTQNWTMWTEKHTIR